MCGIPAKDIVVKLLPLNTLQLDEVAYLIPWSGKCLKIFVIIIIIIIVELSLAS